METRSNSPPLPYKTMLVDRTRLASALAVKDMTVRQDRRLHNGPHPSSTIAPLISNPVYI